MSPAGVGCRPVILMISGKKGKTAEVFPIRRRRGWARIEEVRDCHTAFRFGMPCGVLTGFCSFPQVHLIRGEQIRSQTQCPPEIGGFFSA